MVNSGQVMPPVYMFLQRLALPEKLMLVLFRGSDSCFCFMQWKIFLLARPCFFKRSPPYVLVFLAGRVFLSDLWVASQVVSIDVDKLLVLFNNQNINKLKGFL